MMKKHRREEEEEEEAYNVNDEKITKKKKRSRTRTREVAGSLKMVIKSSYYKLDDEKSIYLFFEGLGFSCPPYLCRIPPMWLCYDNENNNELPKVPSLYKSFNHHLRHKDQPAFTFPEFMPLSINTDTELDNSGMGHSTIALMGSTFYFFGCELKDPALFKAIYYLRKDCISSFLPNSISGKKRAVRRARCMVNAREKPVVVCLDGKAYIFGGNEDYAFTPSPDVEKERAKFVWAEVFEPCEGSLKGQCRPLSLPTEKCNHTPHCAVAVEKAKKIIVCWGEGYTYEYDIVKESWVKIDIKNLGHSICPPVVVDGILYWLYDGMFAYDVEKKLLIEGPFEDKLIQTLDDEEVKVLFHLAEDFFCILWYHYELLKKTDVMHCTIVRVVRDANNNKTPRLRIIVLSCQTFYCLVKINLSLLRLCVFMV